MQGGFLRVGFLLAFVRTVKKGVSLCLPVSAEVCSNTFQHYDMSYAMYPFCELLLRLMNSLYSLSWVVGHYLGSNVGTCARPHPSCMEPFVPL